MFVRQGLLGQSQDCLLTLALGLGAGSVGLGCGEQCQRVLGIAALFFQSKGHRRQLVIRRFQPGTQGFQGGGIDQTRGFLIRKLGFRLGNGLGIGGPFGLDVRQQRLQSLASGGGKSGGFGPGVDLVAGLGKGKVHRLLFADQLGLRGFEVFDRGRQSGDLPAGGVSCSRASVQR